MAGRWGLHCLVTEEKPSLENLDVARGCQAVCVITTPVPAELLDAWKEMGIRAVSTRTVGYEHVDWKHAREIGIRCPM